MLCMVNVRADHSPVLASSCPSLSTRFRFLNAGTMMGRASAIQYYCTRHYLRSGRHHDEGLRDQRCAMACRRGTCSHNNNATRNET